METNRRGLVNRKWIIAILVYIGLIAICCIALYAVPSLKGMLEKTYTAEHGSIDVKDEVSAFIVRDETVFVADRDASINRLVDEHQLVKTGARILELKADEGILDLGEDSGAADEEAAAEEEKSDSKDEKKSGKDSKDGSDKDAEGEAGEDAEAEEAEAVDAGQYTSILEELGNAVVVSKNGVTSSAGYISYKVDGAESRLTTEALDTLEEKDLKSLTKRRSVKTPAKHCGKGYPVFKIIRNKRWYLVYYLDNDDAAKYAEGDTVNAELGEQSVPVTVSQVIQGQKKTKIVLSCKTFFEDFFDERTLDTTVTVLSAEGLVLQDSSIIDAPDGTRGVFIINKLGEHVYKPVKAKADDGTRCVVYSDIYVDDEGNYVETIGAYDEIIAEPSEEDVANLKKQQQKEKEEAEAAAKAKAEEAAKQQAEEAAKQAEEQAKEAGTDAAAETAEPAAEGAQAEADGTANKESEAKEGE